MDKPVPAALRDAIKACDNNQTKLATRLGLKDRQQVNNWVRRGGVPRWFKARVLEIAKEVRGK